MLSVTDLRAGTIFEENGEPYRIVEYKHSFVGRGGANIKVKVKSLKTGSVLIKTYLSGAKVKEAYVERRKMQFLYSDNSGFYFMDEESFVQQEIDKEVLGDQAKFLKDGMTVEVLIWQEKPVDIQLPLKIKYKVIETSPGVRGNSATNLYKPATLENGLKLRVPLFVDEDDFIVVDTRTGEYVSKDKPV